ncbi:hypothetical protein ACFYWS_11980 [Streptomyces sp. NPDC002795]|uniref:hypothetical protein n=1 Tax=Streptomyces sp. NPDC002795 TaxID=3364665 RepID=UPI003696DBDA
MADDAEPKEYERLPILDFLVVRPPRAVDASVLRRAYIRDDALVLRAGKAVREDTDLHSPNSPSRIGRLVFTKVCCEHQEPSDAAMQDLFDALLGLLTPRVIANCHPREAMEPSAPVDLAELERHAHLRVGDVYFVLPDTLDQILGVPLVARLNAVLKVLRAAAEQSPATLPAKFRQDLDQALGGRVARQVVYDGAVHSVEFMAAKRVLFDTLYLLYILRRWAPLDLSGIIDGLRTLHVLEHLAGPSVATGAQLRELLAAKPVIHPMFARLFRYCGTPFNEIKPVGVAELKVVKQWLVGYRPGEISDIHNVMLGELKKRHHRLLSKSEDVFSGTTEEDSETTTDTGSTTRFEVKNECERVVKEQLGANANLSLSYGQAPSVVVNIGGGITWSRTQDRTDKAALNFSQEVVSKAVSRVQSRTVQQRSMTKLREVEERNEHEFHNEEGHGHVSGIYRWVDKEYCAQVFNYGCRMMFEFVLPEPSAFFVDSRLRQHEAELPCLEQPKEPEYKKVELSFTPDDIDAQCFAGLQQKYGLQNESYPVEYKRVTLMNTATNEVTFARKDIPKERHPLIDTYQSRVEGLDGYEVRTVRPTGVILYRELDEFPADKNKHTATFDWNQFTVTMNGADLLRYDDTVLTIKHHLLHPPQSDVSPPADGPILMDGDLLTLSVAHQDVTEYSVSLTLILKIGTVKLKAWQQKIHTAVRLIEQERVDRENQQLELDYRSRQVDYRNKVAEMSSVPVAQLLRGGPESVNRETILTELKRQCLAMISKEFDADDSDDLLTDDETMGSRTVDADTIRVRVDEDVYRDEKKKEKITCVTFSNGPREVTYPLPRLESSRDKGRHIQFLEQAFDWRQISYVFYPYFWRTPKRWVELSGRTEPTDPHFEAFLRAGAVRVLVPVSEHYNADVEHFLCTREPWFGGDAPVIGDQLYLPIHEELRRQQDDRYHATPEGKPWSFVVPTTLVYLQGSQDRLPDLAAERAGADQVDTKQPSGGQALRNGHGSNPQVRP